MALPDQAGLLFSQHGWNDDHRDMARLAEAVAPPGARVVAPNLGLLNTWLAIEPLIAAVGRQLDDALAAQPAARIRVIGHSMGGLIWLELLDRRRALWPAVESLVLLGSPVGGADLARVVDPLGLLPMIARDLGRNRRAIAEAVAAAIPTLVIAGDRDGGSDWVVTVGATQVDGATVVRLPGVWHRDLMLARHVAPLIRQFWGERDETLAPQLVARLRAVPGMTDAHDRDFAYARTTLRFADGTTIREWRNPLGVDHVFVADARGQLRFGGFVGWLHAQALRDCLARIRAEFPASDA